MTGVYFLYLNKNLQYIGKSIDIERRIHNHPINFDYVGIIASDANSIEELEKDQIRKYKPPFNKRIYKNTYSEKKSFLILNIDRDFYEHLKDNAVKKNMTLSHYVRAILKKYTGYKEKELV